MLQFSAEFSETSQHCSVFCSDSNYAITFAVGQMFAKIVKDTLVLFAKYRNKTSTQQIIISIRVAIATSIKCNVATDFKWLHDFWPYTQLKCFLQNIASEP